MGSFDEAWVAIDRAREGEAVSAALRPLLQDVYQQVLLLPLHPAALKQALVNLFRYLSGEGRTNANCWATDLFFCIGDGWESDWSDKGIPEEFHEILVRVGEALHDTMKDPSVAENHGCLPEQLLGSVQKISLK